MHPMNLCLLETAGMVAGLTIVDAFFRPLFMCRDPKIQARYTTFCFLILQTLVFTHFSRVSNIALSEGTWIPQLQRPFSAWSLRLWTALFLVNVARLVFPAAVPLCFPLPSVGRLQNSVLALNKPDEFWSSEKHPVFGISGRSLLRDRTIKIERMTPGLEDAIKVEEPATPGRREDEDEVKTERSTPGMEGIPVWRPDPASQPADYGYGDSDDSYSSASTLVTTPSPGSPRQSPGSSPSRGRSRTRGRVPTNYVEIAQRVALAEREAMEKALAEAARETRENEFFV